MYTNYLAQMAIWECEPAKHVVWITSFRASLKGTHNLIEPENIPPDAAQDSQNFLTQRREGGLVGGHEYLGAAGARRGHNGLP